MKTYKISFVGRLSGALGVNYPCEVTVTAPDIDAAILKVYETHENAHPYTYVEVPPPKPGEAYASVI